MESEAESKTLHPGLRLVITAVAGGVGYYSGLALFIPFIIGLIAALVLTKAMPSRHLFNFVGAVTIGHVGWMMVGSAITGNWSATPDMIVLCGLVCWVLARPGLIVVLIFCSVELIEIAYCIFRMSSVNVGTPDHKALVLHFALYAVVLIYLILAYFEHKRRRLIDRASFVAET